MEGANQGTTSGETTRPTWRPREDSHMTFAESGSRATPTKATLAQNAQIHWGFVTDWLHEEASKGEGIKTTKIFFCICHVWTEWSWRGSTPPSSLPTTPPASSTIMPPTRANGPSSCTCLSRTRIHRCRRQRNLSTCIPTWRIRPEENSQVLLVFLILLISKSASTQSVQHGEWRRFQKWVFGNLISFGLLTQGSIHQVRTQNFRDFGPPPPLSYAFHATYQSYRTQKLVISSTPPLPLSAYVLNGWSLMSFDANALRLCTCRQRRERNTRSRGRPHKCLKQFGTFSISNLQALHIFPRRHFAKQDGSRK